jgi:hypothetical protein
MAPRPYAFVSCDFVVMYRCCSLVGMMDRLRRTFISILGADGAGSYNQRGHLDALAYIFIHNTNSVYHFTPDMCLYIYTHIYVYIICILVYVCDVMRNPFVFFIFLSAIFCYPWNRCVFSHKRGLIK